MAKQFVVTVAPDGSISVETAAMQGPACLDELQTIQALVPNANVVDSRITDHYYQTSTQLLLPEHNPITVKDIDE